MSEHEPYKRKPLGEQLYENLFSRFLPKMIQTFIRSFVMMAFILLTLGGYMTSNSYLRWVIFFLAVYGLWKLFDLLDNMTDVFLKRLYQDSQKANGSWSHLRALLEDMTLGYRVTQVVQLTKKELVLELEDDGDQLRLLVDSKADIEVSVT